MKKILFLALLLNFMPTHACLNYFYSLDNTGHFHDAEDLRRAFNTNFNPKELETNLQKIEVKLKSNHDYKLLSDYAVLLLKAGRTTESLDILEQLSLKHPDDYEIAANLGTAYELSGNVEKALEYIKRGIEINPDAHQGSEWVHVRILETKLKLAQDKNYLSNHSVLNLTNSQKKNEKVRNQLMIQLRERFPFCKGPDPIMASLLIDLGDCYANTVSIEFAKASYEIAHHYYSADKALTDPKIAEMNQLLRQYGSLEVGRATLLASSRNERGTEGEHNHMSRINYKSLLEDNNTSSYAIDWNKVQFNADSLLAYAQIERVMPPPTEEAAEIEPVITPKSVQGTKTDGNNWLYWLIGGAIVLAGGYVIVNRKR